MKGNVLNCLIIVISLLGLSKSAAAQSHYVEINDIRIFYQDTGAGEPLLLLHGGLLSSDFSKPPMDFFAGQFRVIAPDSRGHGRTSDSDKPITYELMADDMVKLLDHLGLDSVFIVGFSDGGNVGLVMASSYPDRVKTLVAIGANFQPDGYTTEDIEWMKTASADTSLPDIANYYRSVSPTPDRWPIFFKKMVTMWLTAPIVSEQQLAGIVAPTLIIAGDRDMVRVDHTVELFEAITDAQLFIVPGVTHFVLEEKPELVHEIILSFLLTPTAEH
jgi:pimeloyl-ACP methyl ester carboxylesterase